MSRSSYQSNGKPLSQQALYQQKLKQGIYTSPSATSVGVNSSASDTAALLAASADLTVKPSYERVQAVEAHQAALAAKKNNIKAWSRDHTDAYADAAAANARTSSLSSNATASSAGTGVPAYKGSSIYKTATANSATTMTSRTNPSKDVMRSGLATKSSGTILNIDKINALANKNSTKSLNSRFNPEADYRSGLKVASHQPPTEYLNQDEEDLAASGAAASLKHGSGVSTHAASQRRSQTFSAVDVVDATLLAAANAKAKERLNTINSSSSKDFKAQAQLYANALTVAQKNSEERLRNNRAGVIDLGGGLTMLQSELDKLASVIVQPVLNDLNTKADAQRSLDKAHKSKQAELAELHQRAKEEEVRQKSQEKADIEIAKQKRATANEERKKGEDEAFLNHQEERNAEVEASNTELAELEKKHAEEKETLLAEKQANQDQVDSEEAELINGRKTELDELQAEKDELLKPTLEELEQENSKLKELTDARDELAEEVKGAETLNEENEAKVAELTEKLEKTKAEIEKYTKDLEDAIVKHEETSKEVEDLHVTSSDELKKAAESHKELDGQLENLEREKQGHLETKAAHKKDILSAIDEKVKDEHKINNELPPHLKTEIDEDKLRDTASLFSVEESKAKTPVVEKPKVEAKEVQPKKKEEVTKTPAPAQKAAPKRSESAIAAANNTHQIIKNKGLKRLSNFFKGSSSREKPAVKAETISKPVSKPAASKPVSQPKETAANEVKKPASQAKNSVPKEVKKQPTQADSIASTGVYDDEISLGNNPNKGGLFKEEI